MSTLVMQISITLLDQPLPAVDALEEWQEVAARLRQGLYNARGAMNAQTLAAGRSGNLLPMRPDVAVQWRLDEE